MRGPEHALSLRSSIAFEPCRAHSHQVHEVQIVFAFDSNSSRSFRSHFRQGRAGTFLNCTFELCATARFLRLCVQAHGGGCGKR